VQLVLNSSGVAEENTPSQSCEDFQSLKKRAMHQQLSGNASQDDLNFSFSEKPQNPRISLVFGDDIPEDFEEEEKESEENVVVSEEEDEEEFEEEEYEYDEAEVPETAREETQVNEEEDQGRAIHKSFVNQRRFFD